MDCEQAVEHINAGNIEAALHLLNNAIASSPTPNMGALIARGTARALQRDLDGTPPPSTVSQCYQLYLHPIM